MQSTLLTAHRQTVDYCFNATASTPQGLDSTEAASRLLKNGPNALPQMRPRSRWQRLLAQFNNVLIYVLLGAALVTASLAHWIDTAVIVAVVLVNATIGYVQEGKAEAAIEAIRHLLAPRATVMRDGRRQSIDSAALVSGDIVLLEAGDRVPADLRIFEVRNVRVDEAILTGESVPVEKTLAVAAADSALGDRNCMLFSGTMILTGTARGLVVATGSSTEIGKISGLLQSIETLTTPLVRQMAVFTRRLTVFILFIAVSLLLFGYLVSHQPFDELFMIVVGLSVAAIPEGLPAVLTITLAVGVQAMAQRNVIVRRLPAIETIGSVSVVCTDKTGTLTRNQMAVTRVVTADGFFQVEADGYRPHGHITDAKGASTQYGKTLADIALVASLCNDAELHGPDPEWRIEGDPMEGALLVLASKITPILADSGVQPPYRRDWARLDVVPFDPAHRHMTVLCHGPGQRSAVLVKGAPESVIAMCDEQHLSDGSAAPLDERYWNEAIESLAAQGQRVIALAIRDGCGDISSLAECNASGSLALLGLVGLIDPPRQETIESIAECQAAGIKVKMITGDHAATACAIARQIGLGDSERVLTGKELDRLDDTALAEAAVNINIFARTSPAHKLRLVEALQGSGLIVAMTGDGVNDTPALKRADIGIAMGLKGSDAAKNSAELVLADDNFASIVAAIREGRRVYDNIIKVISWTLPTNAGEAMTIIAALIANLALPVTAVQILWVNLITAATLGIALAFEPIEAVTMQRPPRDRSQPLLSTALIWHMVLVSTLFLVAVFGVYSAAIDRGYSPELARTIAMNMLVVLEIFHLFFIRNIYGTAFTWSAVRGTPIIWACIALVVSAQFAITYLPGLQRIFGTQAVPLSDGIAIVVVGMVFFLFIEAEKLLRHLFFRANKKPSFAAS